MFWLCLLNWNSLHADLLPSYYFYFSLSPLHEKKGEEEKEREKEAQREKEKGGWRESMRKK